MIESHLIRLSPFRGMVTFSGTQQLTQSQQTELIHFFPPIGNKVIEILIFIAEGGDWLGLGQSHQGEN